MPALPRTIALLTLAASMLTIGCAGVHRRQDRAVDAGLRAKAPRLKRKGRRPVRIGPDYELARVDVREERYDGDGGPGLTVHGAGREVSQFRSVVTIRHASSGRERTSECRSRFVRKGIAKLDGVVGSQSTRISVRCAVPNPNGGTWRLTSSGLEGRDLSGRFVLDGEGAEGLHVELDLYNELNGPRGRPVAHIRSTDGAVAGALFTFPERVWLDPDMDPDAAEASLALLLSLRNLQFKAPKSSASTLKVDEVHEERKGPLERILSTVSR